jgi:hypothetical protein
MTYRSLGIGTTQFLNSREKSKSSGRGPQRAGYTRNGKLPKGGNPRRLARASFAAEVKVAYYVVLISREPWPQTSSTGTVRKYQPLSWFDQFS